MECGISYPEINPTMFSFNSPYGACEECKGLGEKYYFDPSLVVPDADRSLSEGAVAPWGKSGAKKASSWYLHTLESLARHYGFSLSVPFKKLPEKVRDLVLNGSGDEELEFSYKSDRSNYTYTQAFEGVLKNLERRYRETDSEDVREDLERYMNSQPCPVCSGSRLKKEALFIKINNRSVWNVVRMPIKDSLEFFRDLKLSAVEHEIARRVLKEVSERLGFLSNVGLDYISLDRAASTLSGGEGQRIRLATQIGSSLVGVLYILDEPSIGLHQRDNRRLLSALKRLRDMGNSVIVVEHDEETMLEADYIIDMGPGAGEWGGEVVAVGTFREIIGNGKSLTGKYLSRELEIHVSGPSGR